MSDAWLSVPEAARRLGVSAGTVRRLIDDRQIAAMPVGCGTLRPRHRLRPEWVEQYITRKMRPAKDAPPRSEPKKRGRPPGPHAERPRTPTVEDDEADLARSLVL